MHTSVSRLFWSVSIFSLLKGLAVVQAADETPDPAAIMERVLANRPATNLWLDATLTVERDEVENRDLVICMDGTAQGVRLVYREPGSTALLMIEGGDYWLCEKEKSEAHKLTAEERTKPFLGSDFAYEDLQLSFLRWTNRKFIEESRRRGFDCWVIESRPGPNESSQYDHVRCWVDKHYTAVVNFEAYDAKNKVIKKFEVISVMELNDKKNYIFGKIALETVRPKSRTTLRIQKDHPGPVDPAMFAPETFYKTALPAP